MKRSVAYFLSIFLFVLFCMSQSFANTAARDTLVISPMNSGKTYEYTAGRYVKVKTFDRQTTRGKLSFAEDGEIVVGKKVIALDQVAQINVGRQGGWLLLSILGISLGVPTFLVGAILIILGLRGRDSEGFELVAVLGLFGMFIGGLISLLSILVGLSSNFRRSKWKFRVK